VARTWVKEAIDPGDEAVRDPKCRVEIQNVDPKCGVGDDWLRPSHPLADDRALEEEENGTYAVAARIPACIAETRMEYL
jgi:hypothetical protein